MTTNQELVRLRNDSEMEERRALKHEDSIGMNSVGSRWSESEAVEPILEGMDAAELQEYCRQVFHLFDPEGKGYVTRKEIAQFCDRRNSTLDHVMASLDTDHDGQISFEEFQAGFQAFSQNLVNGTTSPGLTSTPDPQPSVVLTSPGSPPHTFPALARRKSFLSNEEIYESNPSLADGGEEWWEVAERIDPDGLLNGTDAQRVWQQLSSKDSAFLEQFESFLSEMVQELTQSQQDRQHMQNHVKRVMDQHNREVSEMEEILEQQLSEVEQDHRLKSDSKTKRLSSHFESLLADREALIEQLATQESTLKHALKDKAQAERKLKDERQRLISANQVLLEQLGSSAQHLAVNRQAVSGLVAKETDDLPTSPEYDSLGRPVHILREYGGEEGDLGTSPVRYYPPIKSPVHKAGISPEIIGDFLQFENADLENENQPQVQRRLFPSDESSGSRVNSRASKQGEEHAAHEEDSMFSSIPASLETNPTSHNDSYMTTSTTSTLRQMNSIGSHDSHMTSHDSHMTNHKSSSPLNNLTDHILSCSTQPNPHHHSSSSSQSNSASLVVSSWLPHRDNLPRPTSPTAVNRVFKVVFLGNSGVGKTSLILQLSEGQFVRSGGSTLGLDFTTKTLKINDERVVFQLWDTAGQERFHNALTTVYFRRADAFVIVYDVTDRRSFQSTKSWLNIIEAALRERPPVVMIVGNKSDRVKERVVSIEEGRRLALELHAMFSEMSALSGDNVMQAHTTLGQLLLARENEEIEKAKRSALELNSREGARAKKCAC